MFRVIALHRRRKWRGSGWGETSLSLITIVTCILTLFIGAFAASR